MRRVAERRAAGGALGAARRGPRGTIASAGGARAHRRGYNDRVPRPFSDTTPEAERVQLDLLRAASPARRGEIALSLSRTVLALARGCLERQDPSAPPGEIDLRFVEALYGRPLADAVRAHLAGRRS